MKIPKAKIIQGRRQRTPELAGFVPLNGALVRLPANHPARSRINMLDPENFTVALLGEFGYYRHTIASELGLSIAQVNRRLKFAHVDPAAYRRGQSVIGQMILRGVSKAGVPQLREFAQATLGKQLRQLGWNAN